jgi:hypothetical protein
VRGQYPLAEHARCRDWSKEPFPFARHLEQLLRLHRRVGENIPARLAIEEAGRALRKLEQDWPQAGLPAVNEGMAQVSAVRTKLGAAGVDAALIARL